MSVGQVVAVAGAGGFVGRSVVRALLSRGAGVRALVRDPVGAAKSLGTPPGLTYVEGDACDTRRAEELCRGAWGVINTIGILRERAGETFERAHVRSVRELTGAACRAGARRFVHFSALGVREDAPTPYQRSKFEGEGVVRESGLAWTILRPSLVHGAEGEFMRLARSWASGRSAPFVFMPYFARTERIFPRPVLTSARIQPIFVEDLARTACDALRSPQAVGEVYHLTGAETLTWPEFLGVVRDGVATAKEGIRAMGIPGELAAMKARALGLLGLGAMLPFDEGMARMGMSDSVSSSRKAVEHLGFAPRGFRESASGYLATM